MATKRAKATNKAVKQEGTRCGRRGIKDGNADTYATGQTRQKHDAEKDESNPKATRFAKRPISPCKTACFRMQNGLF